MARSHIGEHDPPESLLGLSHQQFYNFVDQDVRNRLDTELSQKLRHAAVVERWFQILVQMKKNVESQLASAKEDWRAELFEILAEIEDAPNDARASDLRAEQYEKHSKYSSARAKKLRFRSAVEDSLSEARYLRNQTIEKRASAILPLERNRSHELASAIEEHRSEIRNRPTSSGETVSKADERLWSMVAVG